MTIPLTLDEREDMMVRELRIPATLEEYFAQVQNINYAIHYSRGHIVSFIELDDEVDENNEPIDVGQATPLHERLTALFIHAISNLLGIPKTEYEGYGSKIILYAKSAESAYQSDMTFTKGEAIIEEVIAKGQKYPTKVVTNPHILVEILSSSTRYFDLNEKLPDYQKIDSLKQVIFVEQEKVNIKTYIKQGDRWLYFEFKEITDDLPIFEKNGTIPLSDIYQANMLKRL